MQSLLLGALIALAVLLTVSRYSDVSSERGAAFAGTAHAVLIAGLLLGFWVAIQFFGLGPSVQIVAGGG